MTTVVPMHPTRAYRAVLPGPRGDTTPIIQRIITGRLAPQLTAAGYDLEGVTGDRLYAAMMVNVHTDAVSTTLELAFPHPGWKDSDERTVERPMTAELLGGPEDGEQIPGLVTNIGPGYILRPYPGPEVFDDSPVTGPANIPVARYERYGYDLATGNWLYRLVRS